MKSTIKYDYSYMKSELISDQGFTQNEIDETNDHVLKFREKTFVNKSGRPGYMRLPEDMETLAKIEELTAKYSSKFKTLLVLGIGGSDLGARAVIAALNDPDNGMNVEFLGANTDPHEINSVLRRIDLRKTAINVISKSGDTIETMSTFIYVRDLLIKEVGYESHKEHIVATTDKSKGTLKTISDKEGYDTLVVPDDVGGRFSVLSPVGLFPIQCAGISCAELLKGALDLSDSLINFDKDKLHKAEMFAALHYLGYLNRSQKIHILVPYSFRLKEFGFWYRQLWAESLGKKDSNLGEEIYVGPTPVAALGATDQHSQFQLYYFGPFDKIITFIDVENPGHDALLPDAFPEIDGISYMSGLSFNKIIRTELAASAMALTERKRANGRIVLPEISPYTIGQLIQFFEIATSYMGELLSINAYDQPGVELGKQNMYALFDRSGFHTRKIELENLTKNFGTDILE